MSGAIAAATSRTRPITTGAQEHLFISCTHRKSIELLRIIVFPAEIPGRTMTCLLNSYNIEKGMLRITIAIRSSLLNASSTALVTSTSSPTPLVRHPDDAAHPTSAMTLRHAMTRSSIDLVSHGNSIASRIRSDGETPFTAVEWMQLFSARGVRFEPVLSAAAWKAFKAVVPHHADRSQNSSAPEALDGLVAAVSRAFRLLSEQRLTHDHQLVIAGVGKCIECAPAMRSRNVADVMLGMRNLGRLTLTVAEAESYRSGLSSDLAVEDPLTSERGELARDALHAQGAHVQLLDELADVAESQIVRIASTFDAEEIVDCISAMAVIGVTRSESVEALGTAAQKMHMSLDQITALLHHSVALHTRVVDTLDFHDDPDGSLRDLCKPLFVAIGKRLVGVDPVVLARHHPKLVVQLRSLCEKHSELNDAVPSLWEKIRCVRVTKSQLMRADERHSIDKPLSGGLGKITPRDRARTHNDKKRDKASADLQDPSHSHRFMPAQFRGWLGIKRQQRHLLTRKVATVARFGTQRIGVNYIKWQRRKHEKTHY